MNKASIGDFRYQLLQLNTALHELEKFLFNHTIIETIYLAHIPRITKKEEHQRFLEHHRRHQHRGQLQYAPFPVSAEHNMQTASPMFIKHIKSFYVPVDMSSRFVGRLPGYITLITSQPDELVGLLERVNHAKKALETTIQLLGDSSKERHERLHEAEPGFMTMHAIRSLAWLSEADIKSISFGWEHRQSMKRFSKDEVLTRLYASQEEGNTFFSGIGTEESFQEAVNREIQMIMQYPKNAEFMQKRPLPPTPVARVRTHEERNVKVGTEVTARKRYVAHTPLVLINCEGPKKASYMVDYPGFVQEENEDSGLIIPRLHLYEHTNRKKENAL